MKRFLKELDSVSLKQFLETYLNICISWRNFGGNRKYLLYNSLKQFLAEIQEKFLVECHMIFPNKCFIRSLIIEFLQVLLVELKEFFNEQISKRL